MDVLTKPNYIELEHRYGAEVWGIGSLFEPIRPFRSTSDIDLVAQGIPAEQFISALTAANEMTGWNVDLIPYETANELIREIVSTEGVRL